MISCMFVPPLVIKKIGCKYTVAFLMIGYIPFTLSMFYPTYWTVVPASLLLGFCGAPLWSAKCSYLTSSGMIYGKSMNFSEDNMVNKFFGIFFLIFQSGQIWGNLISSLVLKPSGGKLNSTEANIGEVCGKNFCPSTDISSAHQETSKSTVTLLMSIYLGFGVLAVFFVFIFLDKIKIIRDNKKRGACDLFISTMKLLKNPKMMLLIPVTIFSGLEQGFVFGDFTKAFVTCGLSIEKVGLIMICFGATDAIFSLALSKIVKKIGKFIVILIAALVNFGLLATLLIWEVSENTEHVFYICAGIWGFADAVWRTQVNAFYGVLFSTKQEAAFSNYLLWEAFSFVIAFSYGNAFCINVKIYILIGMLVLGVTFYGVIEWIIRDEKKSIGSYMSETIKNVY
ncbi:protein unc-93 homolog A isoform X1 [Hydra vulgaris]|uniref:protein unc-93 homolog A isoform X1 n=1 Tax=Hydra vulgaris TaxID=6087 RepID=UPI0032EA256A